MININAHRETNHKVCSGNQKLFVPTWKAISGTAWTATAKNWNKSFTNIEHRTGANRNRNRNRSGFSSLNPNPHFCYLLLSSLSVLVLTLTCTYLLPLWSEYLFTLRQRIMCKQMNYPIWFSCRGKSYPDRWKQKWIKTYYFSLHHAYLVPFSPV